jgi:hypothetical protein
MTGRLLPFDKVTHASVDALLPFYVNATLRGEELAFVEQHVRDCEKCQREADWLRKMFASLATGSALPDAPRGVVDPRQASSDQRRQDNRGTRIQERLRTAPPWTRWLLAAQLATIVILGTILASNVRDDAGYRTLGSANPSAQLRDAIAVQFDPATPEGELRRIVQKVDARIVDGPTVTDVFVLEIPRERAEKALQTLRAEHAVRLAERLGPTPRQ